MEEGKVSNLLNLQLNITCSHGNELLLLDKQEVKVGPMYQAETPTELSKYKDNEKGKSEILSGTVRGTIRDSFNEFNES